MTMAGGSDPFGDVLKYTGQFWKAGKWGWEAGRKWRAGRVRAQIEAEYGAEVADAVEAAVINGKDPTPILERAKRAKAEQAEREALLTNPPPLHGSAAWAKPADLSRYLKGRDAFDTPSTILLGAYTDDTELTSFVHWDEDGHLLTIAPTRSGKAQTVIIPNLLRYRGSAIVLDPKGELYAATSAWRAKEVGPVFRWAPFDDAASGLPRHGFNPLAAVTNEFGARSLAEQLFPKDPRAPDFFADDAAAFITALILWIKDTAPKALHHLGTVHMAASQPLAAFRRTVEAMAASKIPTVSAAAENILGKNVARGLPVLRDTLHTKLSRWGSAELLDSLKADDFNFGMVKDQPVTIYLDVPFDMMTTYAPVLRLVLKAALDAMLRNRTIPKIPVLFILDEFLQLGPFNEFRDAIRTHAGSGVRLWFFLQDIAGIEEHYPDGWKPFFNCSVRQFFGIDDPFTSELVGKYLGVSTVAFRSTNAGANVSAQSGGDKGSSSNVTLSSGESIQLSARPLLTPDEIMALLSGWQEKGWRWGIIDMRGPRPFKVKLSPVSQSTICTARLGAYRPI
jgi:type IV secretion system protein VirD4